MRPSGMLCTSLENTRYTWALLTYDLKNAKFAPETGIAHDFSRVCSSYLFKLFLIISLKQKSLSFKNAHICVVSTLPSGSHSGTTERDCSIDSALLQEIQAGKSG